MIQCGNDLTIKFRLILAVFVLTLLSQFSTAISQNYVRDPGIPDTIRIGCPINTIDVPVGGFIDIPVYLFSDSRVQAVSFALSYNSDDVEILRWRLSTALHESGLTDSRFIDSLNNVCGFGVVSFDPEYSIINPGTTLLGHLRMQRRGFGAPMAIDLDSVSHFGPAGYCAVYVEDGNTGNYVEVLPQYADCGDCEVAFDTICSGCTSVEPIVANTDSVAIKLGQSWEFLPQIVDPDSPETRFTYLHYPAWVSVNDDMLSGVATGSALGYDSVVVQVRDECSYSTFVIPVLAYLSGDMDFNEAININDVVRIVNYVFATCTSCQHAIIADVNCDEMVNISDVVYLINYIFFTGPQPGAACK